MSLASLRDLYLEELRYLYDAEAQLLKALPAFARAADGAELRATFLKHLAVTEGQVERLDWVFGRVGEKARRKRCAAMVGLVADAKAAATRDAHPAVRDAALIGAAQKVEHFEVAAYGCVRDYAWLLRDDDAALALQTSMDEEAAADIRLTELAQAVILYEAEDANGLPPRKAAAGGRLASKRKAGRGARSRSG
jgi:ferritin-like metal-binding protein YciE